MVEPPFMMFANIAVSPFCGGDGANLPFEVREVLQPVITFASNGARVIPIVVPLAVWRKVDIPHGCSAGRGLLIADEALPQIIVAS